MSKESQISQIFNPAEFQVSVIEELLNTRNLPLAGTKVELIRRLTEADPSELWLQEGAILQELIQDKSSGTNSLRTESNRIENS